MCVQTHLQVHFVNELQLAELPSVRAEQGADAPAATQAVAPPKALREPPDEIEERMQMMYYQGMAARKRQEWRWAGVSEQGNRTRAAVT